MTVETETIIAVPQKHDCGASEHDYGASEHGCGASEHDWKSVELVRVLCNT